MPDSRFFFRREPVSIEQIAALTGASIIREGASPQKISEVAAPDAPDLKQAAIYCSDAPQIDRLGDARFGACLTTPALAPSVRGTGAVLAMNSPRLGFAILASQLYEERRSNDLHYAGKNSASSEIHPDAFIAEDAKIGEHTYIGPHSVIGPGVEIGSGADIGPNVTILHAIIGNNVTIAAGVRIGQSGFGFEQSPKGHIRVPQLGRVIIGDDVDIGANCTIDRGALGDTKIDDGVKIDNLVHIAHNVTLGRACVIAGQSGISGSCEVGAGVFMGGQVGISDHLRIGDGAMIAGGAGVMRDIPSGERWGGFPAQPLKAWLRDVANLKIIARKKEKK